MCLVCLTWSWFILPSVNYRTCSIRTPLLPAWEWASGTHIYLLFFYAYVYYCIPGRYIFIYGFEASTLSLFFLSLSFWSFELSVCAWFHPNRDEDLRRTFTSRSLPPCLPARPLKTDAHTASGLEAYNTWTMVSLRTIRREPPCVCWMSLGQKEQQQRFIPFKPKQTDSKSRYVRIDT